MYFLLKKSLFWGHVNFQGVVFAGVTPPQKRALFLLGNLRMGVAAAPYGKKLGQMLADDEVAKNPDAFFF